MIQIKFTCPFCSMFCDDLEVSLVGNRFRGLALACPKARAGFDSLRDRKIECEVAGLRAGLREALSEVKQLLRQAGNPLIYLSGEASSEELRAAISLGERVNMMIDTPGSHGGCALPFAVQKSGWQTASLVAAQKSDCILSFSRDWLMDFPRVTMSQENLGFPTNFPMDLTIKGSIFAYFHERRWIAHRENLNARRLFGIPLLKGQGIYLVDPGIVAEGVEAVSELLMLMGEIKDASDWRGLYLAPGGNSLGAMETLQSVTGYPACVRSMKDGIDFSPRDYAIESLLRNHECDLIIFCGYPHDLSDEVVSQNEDTKTILLSTSKPSWRPDVQIPVKRPGIDKAGTVIRTDGSALDLSKVIDSDLMDMTDVLQALFDGVKT